MRVLERSGAMIQRLAQLWASKTEIPKSRWRWFGYLLTLAAVVYLVYILVQGELDLRTLDWKQYGWTFLASLLFYLVSLLIQFFIWTRVISTHRKANFQDLEIYARTVLMRSLPGGAWHWIGRISMYSGATQVPTRVVALGNFLEWVLLILVGAAVTLAFLNPPLLGLLGAVAVFAVALVLASAWQPAGRNLARRVSEGVLWIALDILVWLAGAAILYLFVQAVPGGEKLDFWENLRIWTLSGSISMLIIFLPSSLGIREVTLVWLLQASLTASLALLVALLIRIVFIFADIFWGIAGWVFSQVILRRTTRLPAAPDLDLNQ